MDYTLSVRLSDFNFGEENHFKAMLESKKEVAFVNEDTISAETPGLTKTGTYGEEVS
jgi:hypothetical protein